MKKKLQFLKNAIKTWVKDNKKKINETKTSIQYKLIEVDKIIDQGGGNAEVLNHRASLMKDLNDIKSIDVMDLSQKAKVRWSIEGDENSKYFHGILNCKRSQLAIRGILSEGDWIVDPKRAEDLERPISYDEIKKAVWDCGKNKSPGPDGFTFEFFRKYWNIVDQDIIEVVLEFFASGTFPPGCNSAFIALIPKTHDAKNVNDFHPKIKAMIFKVDFEKAFDSIRWDYLDDVLKSFGFGDKWRSWISGCPISAMDSVLINGSPTSQFQFQKGYFPGEMCREGEGEKEKRKGGKGRGKGRKGRKGRRTEGKEGRKGERRKRKEGKGRGKRRERGEEKGKEGTPPGEGKGRRRGSEGGKKRKGRGRGTGKKEREEKGRTEAVKGWKKGKEKEREKGGEQEGNV
ncbi:RNA-directed DNA polymerase, eukaryota [Tanacetum coccineum]